MLALETQWEQRSLVFELAFQGHSVWAWQCINWFHVFWIFIETTNKFARWTPQTMTVTCGSLHLLMEHSHPAMSLSFRASWQSFVITVTPYRMTYWTSLLRNRWKLHQLSKSYRIRTGMQEPLSTVQNRTPCTDSRNVQWLVTCTVLSLDHCTLNMWSRHGNLSLLSY
jgi:hypothetical protein